MKMKRSLLSSVRFACFRVALAVIVVGWLVSANDFCAGQGKSESPDATQASDQDEAKANVEKPKREPIYDESADAGAQIKQALAQAKKENRRVLIQWGANWCGWCHLLHDMFQKNDTVRNKLRYEYDVVLVDIGQMDKNQDLLEKYEVDLKTNGVPFITLLDADGKVLVNQETASLESKKEDAHEHDEEAVMEFLTKFEAKPVDSEIVLNTALETAKKEKKLVFLHFGAPWCGWCHYLENWMAESEVKEKLSVAFVDLKIDTDRMANGEAVYDRYCKKKSGIPWFVFLDPATGEVVASSDGPGGNVGFPSTDEEITHFCEMLNKCGDRFDTEKIEWFRQSLVANRVRREAARAKK
jgi:thiol-disulfide isomerase/thioredoxin